MAPSTTILTSNPPTYRALLDQYQIQYDNAINSGDIQPFLYPQNTFNVGVLLLYLLIPTIRPRLRRYARYPAFALITYFSVTTIRNCRSLFLALGFGVGLLTAWGLLWSATLIIFDDAPADFKRIERRQEGVEQDTVPQDDTIEHVNGSVASGTDTHHGKLSPQRPGRTHAHANTIDNAEIPKQNPPNTKTPASFTWQSYPTTSFLARLDWILDLSTNMRGIGWTYRISSVPSPPAWVETQLQQSSNTSPSTTTKTDTAPNGIIIHQTLRPLLRQNIPIYITSYLSLDLIKVLMMSDPYFLGLPSQTPPTYLPTVLQTNPSLLRSYRLTLSLLGIHLALRHIFSLGPLLLAGILGPRILGTRGEPWMYPSANGSYSNVLDKGLAGWWGGWWHQMFRGAFSAPTRALARRLNWDQKARKTKMLELFVAFALSGGLHACGSYSQLAPTRPLNVLLFFMLQPFGIIFQLILGNVLASVGVLDRLPKWMKQAGNFIFTHVWGYFTAPLLTDDFARGGVWLFEPVPVSLVRGLGFGLQGEGWWCWGGRVVRWHQGKSWWESGIAI